MVDDFSVSKCKLLFFILDQFQFGLLRGLCLKLKTFFLKQKHLCSMIVLNYISFKAKSKCQKNIRDGI